jgi:hypothetical protein
MTRFARRAADADQRIAWAAWLITAAIFVTDLDHPPGYAIPLLYTLAVLLAMWSPRPRLAIEIAAAATALTGLDFFLWSEGGDRITGLFNRTRSSQRQTLTAASHSPTTSSVKSRNMPATS